jgi:hypothetical protein
MNGGGACLVALVATSLLSACSWGSYIGRSSVDYNDTVEGTTNNLLVVNVLRGRDSAPLSFSDLSQIRGSLSTSASGQATWPFGPFDKNLSRTNSLQLGALSIQTNPTFDIAPLNTKNFAEGINEPVKLNLMWYYLQRYEPKVILPLFISRIEDVQISDSADGSKQISSTTRITEEARADKIIGWLTGQDAQGHPLPAKVNVFSKASDVGPALPPGILNQRGIVTDISQASAAGLKINTGSDGKLHLTKSGTHAVLCVPSNGHYEALAIASASVVSTPAGIEWPDSDADCTAVEGVRQASPPHNAMPVRHQTVVHLRSVEAMFYYLGTVVDRDLGPAKPGPDPLNAYLNFHLYNQPIPEQRFYVNYRGKFYYVSEAYETPKKNEYTLAILGLLNDLLNLHRDAAEIPTTKAVQSVP